MLFRSLQQFPWLVFRSGDSLTGYAYATRHRERPAYQWAVEVSVYVQFACRRSGIGHALYQALFGILVQQGYSTAYAGIALPNPASVALHQALGFEAVGVYRGAGYKLGAWWDVSWWQRPLQAYTRPAGPPRSLPQLGIAQD